MHPEQRANRMYLNKRTNSTEELQLKQDQVLKERRARKNKIYFSQKMKWEPTTTKSETKQR
jgi:hypothetical protein